MDTTAFWLPIIGLLCFGFGILVGFWLAGGDLPTHEEQEQPQWERDANEVAQQAWRKWR